MLHRSRSTTRQSTICVSTARHGYLHKPFCAVATVQFSPVQDGIYALEKAHMRSNPSLSQKFPQRCLRNGSNVRLIDAGPLSSFQGRSSSASCFHASFLQAIDGVMSMVLRPQVVSQVPQYFRFAEKQATCEDCFARQSICSSFPFTQACQGKYTHGVFKPKFAFTLVNTPVDMSVLSHSFIGYIVNRRFFHRSLRLEQSPFLSATCSKLCLLSCRRSRLTFCLSLNLFLMLLTVFSLPYLNARARVCVCVFESQRQTDRQTGRQTDRQRLRQRDIQTDTLKALESRKDKRFIAPRQGKLVHSRLISLSTMH